MDITTLGVALDTSDLKQGEAALNSAADAATSAADALDSVSDAGTRTAGTASKLASEYSGLGGSVGQVNAALGPYLASLQQELDLLGLTRSETEAYIARAKGLSETEQQLAAALGAKIDAWHRSEDAAKQAAAAEDQAAKSADAFIARLKSQADAAGKSSAEILQLKAAQLGVSQEAAPLIAQIEGASKATGHFSGSAAGARRELIVLAHEMATGNWSRFGGSLMVLGERLDVLGALMSPLGLAIGAVAAGVTTFALAAYKGYEETDRLNKALASTSGYAGMTAGQIEAMAQRIGASSGHVTAAEKALTELVASGRFAGGELQAVGAAALAMSEATGESADKVVRQFVAMADDVAKGAAKMNEQYHFLTIAQYDEIETLQKHGDKAGAMTIAAEALTGSLERQKVPLGTLPTILHEAEVAWGNFWRAAMNAGKPDTPASHVESLKEQIKQITDDLNGNVLAKVFPATANANRQLLEQLKAELVGAQRDADLHAGSAEMAGILAGIQSDGIAAAQHIAEMQKNLRSRKQIRDEEIASIHKFFADARAAAAANPYQVDPADYSTAAESALIAAANEKYKDKKTAAPHRTDNAVNASLADLQSQQRIIEDALRASLGHIKSMREQGTIDEKEALVESYAAEQLALQKRIEIDQQQLEIAKGKKNTEAYRKYADDIARLQAQMLNNYQKFGDEIATYDAKQAAALKAYSESLNEQLGTQQLAASTKLVGLSLGGNDRADYQTQIKLLEDYDKKVAALTKSLTENRISPGQYDAELKATQDYYDRSVAIARQSSADIKAANGSWEIGAVRAVQDYGDQAANVASSTAGVFGNAFKGMEDALATFATTGKLSFTSLANSIISDIARMEARAAMSGIMNALMPAVAGFAGDAFGMSIGGTYGPQTQAGLDNLISSNNGWGTVSGTRASGGGVDAGSAYLVGENGPELFRPGVDGTIVPNNALSSGGSGGGGDVYIDARTTVEGSSAAQNPSAGSAMELQKKITQAVRAVIQDERRQGGALWKMQNGIA